MHPNLLRLDLLAAHVATDPHVQAVLGLGSAGAETHRFDDHSDIDFFLIIDTPDSKHRYLHDTSWLNLDGAFPDVHRHRQWIQGNEAGSSGVRPP
ncbi:hypothetical protein [Ornithinimicrobium sp. LYQ103]|uniref:hypothetical protein n=1 Tax=Ornithinimicrobium sp. LYQ103 TaxID=3378796 RepID=UPI003854B08B